MDKLVSVLSPCYNHERHIDEYVGGLLAQSYRNLEIIIIDDCSTDASWEVLKSHEDALRSAFPRVILERNAANLGLLGTMERMAGMVTGEYLCTVDTDDFFYPERVKKGVDWLDAHPETDVVHSDLDFHYQKEGRLARKHWASLGRSIPQGWIFEQLMHENFILGCTATCRSKPFLACADYRLFRERGYRTADYAVFLKMSRAGRIDYLDEALACYRVVRGSISHAADGRGDLEWKKAYFQVKLDFLDEYEVPAATRARAERQYNETLVRLATLDRDRETFKKGMKELARKRLVSRRRRSAYRIEWLAAANPMFYILRPAMATLRRRGIIAKQA